MNTEREFHVTDGSTDGDTVHIRRYDEDTLWTVETAKQSPKIQRRLLASGATVQENKYADSLVCIATTEQLIHFLAAITNHRVKLTKIVKRQYSEATRAILRERLAKLRALQDGNPHSTLNSQSDFSSDLAQNDTDEILDPDFEEDAAENDDFDEEEELL